jgi:hypothetical protein
MRERFAIDQQKSNKAADTPRDSVQDSRADATANPEVATSAYAIQKNVSVMDIDVQSESTVGKRNTKPLSFMDKIGDRQSELVSMQIDSRLPH